MNRRDRLANIGLLGGAAITWLLFGIVLLTLDPRGNAAVLLLGALLVGGAAATTVTPLFWLAAFARGRGIAYRGDWWRAIRRGLLVGLVVALFVVLRGQGLLSLPVAAFVIVMAVLVELTLHLRR